MSIKAMVRVFEKSKESGSNRLMLLCIADNANDGNIAWPGMDTLASKMGPDYSRRAAQQRVAALAKTGELGVYPRPGGSHEYILFTGLSISEAKTAIKSLMERRGCKSISQLAKVRRNFAGGANETSQGVRRLIRTNRNEPSVNHHDSKESASKPQNGNGKKPTPVLEDSPWTRLIAKWSFGATFAAAAASPAITGQIHHILNGLRGEKASLEETEKMYEAWAREEKGRLSSPDTIARRVAAGRSAPDVNFVALPARTRIG